MAREVEMWAAPGNGCMGAEWGANSGKTCLCFTQQEATGVLSHSLSSPEGAPLVILLSFEYTFLTGANQMCSVAVLAQHACGSTSTLVVNTCQPVGDLL